MDFHPVELDIETQVNSLGEDWTQKSNQGKVWVGFGRAVGEVNGKVTIAEQPFSENDDKIKHTLSLVACIACIACKAWHLLCFVSSILL